MIQDNFIQITANNTGLYALDGFGQVWIFRPHMAINKDGAEMFHTDANGLWEKLPRMRKECETAQAGI